MTTAERDSMWRAAIPVARAGADGVAVHVRSALLDDDIVDHVTKALKWNFDTPEGVTAIVRCGCVTLHGVVDWSFQRQAAERAVHAVVGVRSITNEIRSRHTAS